MVAVELGAPQAVQAALAVGLRGDQWGVAQHPEVVESDKGRVRDDRLPPLAEPASPTAGG